MVTPFSGVSVRVMSFGRTPNDSSLKYRPSLAFVRWG
jgi:hypothetical protein